MKPFLCVPLALSIVACPSLASEEGEGELVELRAKWQEARRRVLDPIDRSYRKELERLLQDVVKRGDSSQIEAISAEIRKLDAGVPASDFNFEGKWRIVWAGGGKTTALVRGREVLIAKSGKVVSWRITGDEVMLRWPDGTLHKLKIAPDNLDRLKGHEAVWTRLPGD